MEAVWQVKTLHPTSHHIIITVKDECLLMILFAHTIVHVYFFDTASYIHIHAPAMLHFQFPLAHSSAMSSLFRLRYIRLLMIRALYYYRSEF